MNPGRYVDDKLRADTDQDLVGVGADKFSRLARDAGVNVMFEKGTPKQEMKKAVGKSLN